MGKINEQQIFHEHMLQNRYLEEGWIIEIQFPSPHPRTCGKQI